MNEAASSTRFGKYSLIRRLGAGGMGEVFLAQLNGADGYVREVALKVIDSARSSEDRLTRLFLREARALAALSHRGIVQVFDFDRVDGRLYLAMEYLRGLDLRAMISSGTPLPWEAAAYVGAEVARALGAAHDVRSPDAPAGLIHGDLSPSNVMLCLDGAVKVVDFGLARPAQQERSHSGVEGKLPYLAPETLAGNAEPSADLYALGVTLYEITTLERPIRAANDLELLRRILTPGRIPPPSAKGKHIPAAFDEIVLRAMDRDVRKRHASARQLADELDALLAGRFSAEDLAALVAKEHRPLGAPLDLGPPSATVRPSARRLSVGALAALAVAAVVAGAALLRGRSSATPSATAAAAALPAPPLVTTPSPPLPTPTPTGALVVNVSAPVASLALNGVERPVTEGRTLIQLPAGTSYLVALVAPDGRSVHRTLVLKPGEVQEISLPAARLARRHPGSNPPLKAEPPASPPSDNDLLNPFPRAR